MLWHCWRVFLQCRLERLLFRAWRKKFQTALILLSSFFLGCAIWAMHFVGMLACDLPTHSYFDPALTILSFYCFYCICFFNLVDHALDLTFFKIGFGVGIDGAWYFGHALWHDGADY